MLANACEGRGSRFFYAAVCWSGQSSAHEGVTSAAKIKPVVEVAFVLDTTGSMGAADRRRQAQDLVDRHRDRRCQSRRRNPHGPGRLSRHRRRLRHQDLQPHQRHPGPLRQSAGTQGARRRRLAGKRQRGAARRRDETVLDARLGNLPHHVPGRRRAAAHGLCAGREISGGDAHGARARHRRQRRAGGRRARYRAGVARDRADGPRPLHPDPAGRRPSGGDRDALRHRDHRAAGRDQRHGDPLRPAPAARRRRAEDPAGRRRAGVGRHRNGRLHVAQRGEKFRRSHHRRRRSGGGRQGRAAEARRGQGRRPAGCRCAT